MGARICQIAVAIGVFACSACGGGLGSLAARTPSTSPTTMLSAAASASPEASPPFVDPSVELNELGRHFVVAALAYDAWTEEQRDFLTRLGDLVTDGELARLRGSERAHLRWWVLRQRLEQVTVRVTGVSQQTQAGGRQAVHVEAVRVTRSSASTVRDFVDITLIAVRTQTGWRVDRAEGGGL